jgi:hypothetical protein
MLGGARCITTYEPLVRCRGGIIRVVPAPAVAPADRFLTNLR